MSPSSVMSVAAVPYRPVTHVPLGIGYMLMAVALFGGMDAAVKWLGGSYPTLQIMFFRSVFAMLPTLLMVARGAGGFRALRTRQRSEEHTSELQSLMRISYAVFCLKKITTNTMRLTP